MSYDAAIVGAGPAGSAAARLLASWGHEVIVLQRPDRSGPALAESIPPSCRKLFEACGLVEAIDAAGCYRSSGNTVWWGSDEPRREAFPAGALGYQVDRAAFDDLLRREAAAAGARLQQALVRHVEVRAPGVRLRCDDGLEIDARFALDCSGRAGVVARKAWRSEAGSHPRTVALAGVWTAARGWNGVDPTHTLVESYEDGWAWSVPLSPRLRYVTAMVDPRRTRLARGRHAAEVYAAELGKARHLRALIDGSALERGPWGFDASVYGARTYASDPLLLAGDAASFVDPLSSYGIKKALASAWIAAVAVHTALRTPAMTGAALAFHDAHERDMATSLQQQARTPFLDGAAAHPHPFWIDRASESDLPGSKDPDVRALRDDPRVQQAFAWLKAQGTLTLRAGRGIRREPHPVVRGRAIVMEERLVPAAFPDGIRFLRDVDLLGVVELAPSHAEVPALFASYNRRHPPVALPDFLGALSVLIAFGVLEDAAARSG